MDAGVQLFNVMVRVTTADRAGTPSKVVPALAGALVLLPDPGHVPEIVKVRDNPFAIRVL